jgi:cytochrome c biogenesis protein CcmG/thiol:disulfide interchange protein DsbE
MEIRVNHLARTVALIAAAVLALAAPALAIPRAGEAAPPFTLGTADGKSIAVAGLKGKPVYLNFFATWCGPCRVETPAIVKLSKKYAAKGLRVVGIDVGENAGKAQGFAKDYGVPYTLAIDPDSTTRASYGGGLYFPLHVFIDAKGVVKMYHPGEMSDGDIEAAIAAIMK